MVLDGVELDSQFIQRSLDEMDQGLSVYDADLRLIMCNARFGEILRLPPELAAPGVTLEQLATFGAARGDYGPGDEAELVARRLELARSREAHRFERSLEDGAVTLEVRSTPLSNGGLITTYTDISGQRRVEIKLRKAYDDLETQIHEHTSHLEQEMTERLYTEEALRASEERYRATINFTSEGYWAIDPETGLTIEVNDALCQMLGFEADEMVGRKPLVFANRETQRMLAESWRRNPVTDQWSYEIVLKAKDGRDVYALVNATSIKGEDGKPTRIFAFIRDISARRFQEERLAKSEMQARLARKDAEIANRAKSDFLSSMSHELRTPLNAILGFGQLLQFNPQEPLTPAQNDHVNQILEAGSHLLTLINEVLDLSKIEAGKVNIELKDVPVETVFAECRTLVSSTAGRYGVSLDPLPERGEWPVVKADHIRFKQSLLNLLSNAVKYNRPEGRVWMDWKALPQGVVRVVVGDTGHGIPEDKRAEIFDSFSRLGAESTEIEGTGIGLSITRKLVEMMDGEIGFESAVGEGSQFWIDLPLADGFHHMAASNQPEMRVLAEPAE